MNNKGYTARWYKPPKIEIFRYSTDESYNYEMSTQAACNCEIWRVVEERFKAIYGDGRPFNPNELSWFSCRTDRHIYNKKDSRLLVAVEFPGNGTALIVMPDNVYKREHKEGYTYFTYGKRGKDRFGLYSIYEEMKTDDLKARDKANYEMMMAEINSIKV